MAIRERISYALHHYLRVPFLLNVVEFQAPKKPRATFILLHGIGNSTHAWDELVPKLPSDVRIIGIDLLGFGKSPKPTWALYNATAQARSVGMTILKLQLTQQPILVGHSLGALVAVKAAKRYPLAIRRLVLCSPPFYKHAPTSHWQDKALRKLYTIAVKRPRDLRKFSPLAVKLGIANKALDINEHNVASYVATLQASIINQTSLDDIVKLRMPIDIFYGRFDPVVVKKYIVSLDTVHKNISAQQVLAAHEVTGRYTAILAKHLAKLSER